MVQLKTEIPISLPRTTDESSSSRFVHGGHTWEQYLALDELFTGTGVRVRFLKRQIELMSISRLHEQLKSIIGHLIEAHCVDREIEFQALGSFTMKIEAEAGGEPDECYFFDESQEWPDLAIEVALTSGGLSKRAFYQTFKVRELWIWREDDLEIHVLDRETGEYKLSKTSLVRPEIDMSAFKEAVRESSIPKARKKYLQLTA